MGNKFSELKSLLEKAYAPYSNFFVSSIVVPENNHSKFFNGVNVENASFGATICAERSAITSMVSNGYQKIYKLHLLTSSKSFVYPCGICLQFISEFVTSSTKFLIYNFEGQVQEKFFRDLMPYQIFVDKEIK